MASAPTRFVLIIDDNALNRDMLVDYVESLGYEGAAAAQGKEGMEIVARRAPDAILLDLDMPVMDGYAVLDALQAHAEWRHIPVVMISGKDDLQTMTDVLARGAVDYMPKPFKPSILKARLHASFERKDLRDRERALLRDLEKSYSDLRAAEAGRDALTHMIVHDLGNPLAVIKMNADMLQMGAAMGSPIPSDMLAERVAHIASASTSMDLMIRSMLDIAKMESGQLEPQMERQDPTPLLHTLASRFRPVAGDAGMQIEVDAPEGDHPVAFDAVLLERVLANLMANAFKYAHGADRLVLRYRPDDRRIEVEDNGPGIPEAVRERIFEKFYQAEAASGAPRVGIGLGLAFCRMAMEVMGGSIRAEQAEPEGSRFALTLSATTP